MHYDPSEAEFFGIYERLAFYGKLVSPRGQLVLEVEDFSYTLSPYVRFQNFECRKMNLDYIKAEMLWYLKGDKYDTSIASKAKMWQGLINKDGSINSNYGHYVFAGPKQFDYVVKALTDDRDSRRAAMMILSSDHLLSDTSDFPCTYSIAYRIRNNKLNMSVAMRSQDCIFGMTNDAPAFSFMHEMMLNALRRPYPELELGTYHHTVNSFHAYARHFKMLEELSGVDLRTKDAIAGWKPSPYVRIDCPRISGPDEVDFLRALDFSDVPSGFAFTRWLTT